MGIESFVKYEPAYLIYFSFDIRDLVMKCEERPDLENAKSELAVSHNISFEQEGERLRCGGTLDVTWTVIFEEDDGNAEFIAECGMVGAASCAYIEGDEETLRGILAPNLIVFLWGKIRDLIEDASMVSPLDRIILPAIDPVALLNQDNEGGEGE